MPRAPVLVGRDHELAQLGEGLAEPGRGGLTLLAGEAGMGKTRLAEEAVAATNLLVLRGGSSQDSTPPYGPVAAALRAYLRVEPKGLDDVGPLKRHLALLLPELGPAASEGSSATILEALRCAFETIARRGPTCVVLDDLHWADQTTLVEVLPVLAAALEELPMLVVGAYRSDEIPRGHPLRMLRRDLRRAGRAREIVLGPLDAAGTAVLAAQVLGGDPSPALSAQLYELTQGVPFFVEELSAALVASGRTQTTKRGVELEKGEDVPLPDTVRDAVLLRAGTLSEGARSFLEVAAVAGLSFELPLVVDLAGETGLDEAIESGMLVETETGRAGFHHALAREALYGDVRWTRRRALHRQFGRYLDQHGASAALVAEHWLAAHDYEKAAPTLVTATEDLASVHAYRDALRTGRRAAELWPEGSDEPGRLALLERVGHCAQLCGELAEAVVAWREVADARRAESDIRGLAEVERLLATAYDLQGAPERAIAARRKAADAFTQVGVPGEAAAELLAIAAHLDSAGRLTAALDTLVEATAAAERAGRRDFLARALGIRGTVTAKLGRLEDGLADARAALALALSEDLTDAAVDAYQRLANVLENSADLAAAEEVYRTAYGYCDTHGARVASQVCLICIAFILFETGQWKECAALDLEIMESPDAPLGPRLAATHHLGLIAAAQGDARRARKFLDEISGYGEQHERERWMIWDILGNAWVDELRGDVDGAAERCRLLLVRWGESESRHYPLPALRWATTFFATHGLEDDARACTAALSRLATHTVSSEALAALAHGLGETSLLDGQAEQAAIQFCKALDLLRDLRLPYEAAQTALRAGIALAAAGRREEGVDRLVDAYRTARRLGARPLAERVAREMAALGEPVERRLGRKAAAALGGPGLSRRELEVMKLIAGGRTNKEIAQEFFLSPRTIDMHVRNIFVKLGCRSRAEATHKAIELGLIA